MPSKQAGLPSWVPDYHMGSEKLKKHVYRLEDHLLSAGPDNEGRTSQRPAYSAQPHDWRVLAVRGLHCDEIKAVLPEFPLVGGPQYVMDGMSDTDMLFWGLSYALIYRLEMHLSQMLVGTTQFPPRKVNGLPRATRWTTTLELSILIVRQTIHSTRSAPTFSHTGKSSSIGMDISAA